MSAFSSASPSLGSPRASLAVSVWRGSALIGDQAGGISCSCRRGGAERAGWH